jgi:hypothetical protein
LGGLIDFGVPERLEVVVKASGAGTVESSRSLWQAGSMTDIPAWPANLPREQQKAVKKRSECFDAALKRDARAAGWRYARGTIFRQSGGWFISILPSCYGSAALLSV